MKKATEFQILTIQGILKQCDVQFDAAQAFIDAHLPTGAEPPAPTPKDFDAECVARLEAKFPGFGEQIMKFLEPFYGWTAELMPPNEILIAQALNERRLEYSGCSAYRRSDQEQLWLAKASDIELANAGYAHGWNIKALFDGSMPTVDAVIAWLRECLAGAPFMRMLDERTCDVLFHQLAGACTMVTHHGSEANEFSPLICLWLNGNFPLGQNRSRNLLILAAD